MHDRGCGTPLLSGSDKAEEHLYPGFPSSPPIPVAVVGAPAIGSSASTAHDVTIRACAWNAGLRRAGNALGRSATCPRPGFDRPRTPACELHTSESIDSPLSQFGSDRSGESHLLRPLGLSISDSQRLSEFRAHAQFRTRGGRKSARSSWSSAFGTRAFAYATASI